MNKKGEKLISMYWFVILFLVAGAVSYIVISFYGSPYDIRESEANALNNKVANCLTENGYLIDFSVEGFKENFLDFCNINFDVEDTYGWRDSEQYLIELTISLFDSGQELFFLQEGDLSLKDFCGLEGDNFPVCLDRSFYSLDQSGQNYEINILSVVRKTEKNSI